MTRGSVAFVVIAFVAMSTGVLAQQRLERVFPGQRPKVPLFQVQPFENPQGPRAPQAVPQQPAPQMFLNNANVLPNLKPRVVCGMTLLPAPPNVDPKIATDKREPEKPKDQTTYTVRPIQPSICW